MSIVTNLNIPIWEHRISPFTLEFLKSHLITFCKISLSGFLTFLFKIFPVYFKFLLPLRMGNFSFSKSVSLVYIEKTF